MVGESGKEREGPSEVVKVFAEADSPPSVKAFPCCADEGEILAVKSDASCFCDGDKDGLAVPDGLELFGVIIVAWEQLASVSKGVQFHQFLRLPLPERIPCERLR